MSTPPVRDTSFAAPGTHPRGSRPTQSSQSISSMHSVSSTTSTSIGAGIGGVLGGPGTVRPHVTVASLGGAQAAGGVATTAVVVPAMSGAVPPTLTHNDIALLRQPTKTLHDKTDLPRWTSSTAFFALVEFVQQLSASVRGIAQTKTWSVYGLATPIETRPTASEQTSTEKTNVTSNVGTRTVSARVKALANALTRMRSWIEQHPPLESPQRFGNLAFRSWAEHVESAAVEIHADIIRTALEEPLPDGCSKELLEAAVVELIPYLVLSFGHRTRIDYGSGHELSFVAWLFCLWRIHFLVREDFELVINYIFVLYLDMVRDLQRTYNLEPAGSHGVWGLDDFQFLPYYFGASQLMDHSVLRPKSVLNRELLDYYRRTYMYFGCISFIVEVKRGLFYEHSPLLYDISGVHSWTKVHSGMLKMWIAEVLYKFPVVQHLPFGSLLSLEPVEKGVESQSS